MRTNPKKWVPALCSCGQKPIVSYKQFPAGPLSAVCRNCGRRTVDCPTPAEAAAAWDRGDMRE